MPQRPYVIDELISAKAIAARIEALSRAIKTEFKDTDKLVVVGLLRGSFVFIADLVRELDLPVEVDFSRRALTATVWNRLAKCAS
jgi:hypoxanthine phosphoribosyltransferase